MRREDWMPVAAQRRLESSGLDKSFPRSGDDHTGARQPGMSSGKTCVPFNPLASPSSAACSRPACSRQARLYHLGGLFPTCLPRAGWFRQVIPSGGDGDMRLVWRVGVFILAGEICRWPCNLACSGLSIPEPAGPSAPGRPKQERYRASY